MLLLLRNLLLLCVLVVRVGLALDVGAVGVRRGGPGADKSAGPQDIQAWQDQSYLEKVINPFNIGEVS